MVNFMNERYSRQSSLVPENLVNTLNVVVVGVGAIGRQVALQSAAMGVNNIKLIDFDIVEESNIASQGYYESDLGKHKVAATAEACRKINSSINIEEVADKFKKRGFSGDVVFCCVDSISIRKFLWNAVKDDVKFFIDGRMAGETLRVISSDEHEDNKKYFETTFFSDDEAFTGSCTAKSTIYCANIAAGFMVSRFVSWMRNSYLDNDVLINLLSNEIIARTD